MLVVFYHIKSASAFLRFTDDVTYTYLSNRIVGGVDDDSFCLRVEFTGKLVWVKDPISACDCLLSRLLLQIVQCHLSCHDP